MDVNLQDSNILTQNKNFIIRNFEKNDIDQIIVTTSSLKAVESLLFSYDLYDKFKN